MNMLPEVQIAAAMNDPYRNLWGKYGPMHHDCSGLGKVIRISPIAGGPKATGASRCSCGGSGIDMEMLWRKAFNDIYSKLDAIEKREMERVKREAKRLTHINRSRGKASRQYWSECIAWVTADGTAVANLSTETIIFPNVTIPANYMNDGRVLRLELSGRYGTTGTETLTFRCRWNGTGGTAIAASGAFTTGSGITTGIWTMWVKIQTRTNGSTGTVFGMGEVTIHEDAVATAGTVTNYGLVQPMGSAGATAPSTASLDLTADTPLTVSIQHGTQNASNTLQGHLYTIESLN